MSPLKQHPNTSREELIALKEQLGTWKAVEERLGLSHHQLHVRKCELGLTRKSAQGRQSQLDPYYDVIAELAADGATCPEIVRELDLPVQPEQVRRYMHHHNIPLLAKEGAQPGRRNHAWNGGRIVDKAGYILVWMPEHPYANSGGYVREHRLVMEQKVRRYLEPGEVVHHINDNPADNDPENLELFSSNGEHLGETLKGKVPNWSEEGKQRIVEAVKRARAKEREQASG